MANADEVQRMHDRMKSDRRIWERDWQDIRELVRPYGSDFQRNPIAGEPRTLRIYDGTAVDALEQLAGGLHSFLCNPVDRWFSLSLSDERAEADDDTLLWLEQASDRIYNVYSDDNTCFNQAIHECFLDLGSFGTCFLSQEWSDDIDNIFFRSHPAASCWVRENYRGIVDTVHREWKWSLRQIVQKFGAQSLTSELRSLYEKDPEKQYTIIHRVAPRQERQVGRMDALNRAYESVYLCQEAKCILGEEGFYASPFHVARWVKMAEEVYGRSPASKCLPDIRVLNLMEKTMLKAAQKLVDPPLVVENENVLLPLKTHAGALIFKEPGSETPEPLPSGVNLPINMEMSQQRREHIKSCFFADWIRLEKENVEMTATEVMDRREEKLRLIAPILGRLQSELLGPVIQRTHRLLGEKGRLPKAPQQVRETGLKITYVSPAARAQTGVKALAMARFVQDLAPILQVKPDVADAVDWDKYVHEYSVVRGVTRVIFRNKADLMRLRENNARMQQAQAMAQTAEPASQAFKNIAEARANGADVTPLLQAAGMNG